MRRIIPLLFMAVCMMASGCTLTLHSLFTSKDVSYDPTLDGIWQSAEATWTLKPVDKPTGRYALQVSIKDQPPAEFYATLGTVGTNRFLELTPQRRPTAIHPKTFFGGHFVQLHSFWKVGLNGDTLALTSMSTQWFQAMTQQKKIDIKYEKPDSGDQGLMFLTASTQELQEFVAKYADDPGAFPSKGDEKGIVFARSKEPAK